ncbi:MAG: Peptidyl-tRNA hydrolase [candidate division TM6 bacterium GW2011_GWF2_38_10]|nr:MAG: Peptidyl-tRNA hydrolase [candidate division TM6 bacterium GW2011_GWF2_38_10]
METSFSITTIKAIIGLGNPGKQYEKNRHNIGFCIVDALAHQYEGSWKEHDNAFISTIQLSINATPHPILLIKPQTYMNNSGKVIHLLQKKGIKPHEILVIHDELEKSFGLSQVRLGGSARGHNGLKSIISVIGEGFWRLRFGIGRPTDKADVPNYVLANFSKEEILNMPLALEKAINLIICQ